MVNDRVCFFVVRVPAPAMDVVVFYSKCMQKKEREVAKKLGNYCNFLIALMLPMVQVFKSCAISVAFQQVFRNIFLALTSCYMIPGACFTFNLRLLLATCQPLSWCPHLPKVRLSGQGAEIHSTTTLHPAGQHLPNS
jgi:hypothetical protein